MNLMEIAELTMKQSGKMNDGDIQVTNPNTMMWPGRLLLMNLDINYLLDPLLDPDPLKCLYGQISVKVSSTASLLQISVGKNNVMVLLSIQIRSIWR